VIPIILHHGLFGYDQLSLGRLKISYFHRIDRALAAAGHPLILSRVHPTAPIERRASELKKNILREINRQSLAGRKMLLIAHSMGGLDARYMIHRLGMAGHIAALLTISTPHHGSPYADWCLRHIGQRLRALRLFQQLGIDVRGIHQLTPRACHRFNEQIPNHPAVRYFSISAARPWHHVPPFAWYSHHLIQQAEGDNDGLVSVRSAQWGTHLATWPADHWHTVNKRFVLELKNPTGDITPHYLDAVQRIARQMDDVI
jgi:triacylglycerol lipase